MDDYEEKKFSNAEIIGGKIEFTAGYPQSDDPNAGESAATEIPRVTKPNKCVCGGKS